MLLLSTCPVPPGRACAPSARRPLPRQPCVRSRHLRGLRTPCVRIAPVAGAPQCMIVQWSVLSCVLLRQSHAVTRKPRAA